MQNSPNYRNKLEAKVAKQLPSRFQFETTKLPYVIARSYLPDFIDPIRKEIIECKGFFPAADRQKMKAVAKAHPDYQITIVFQDETKTISKTSKTTYAGWTEANGMKWRRA